MELHSLKEIFTRYSVTFILQREKKMKRRNWCCPGNRKDVPKY